MRASRKRTAAHAGPDACETRLAEGEAGGGRRRPRPRGSVPPAPWRGRQRDRASAEGEGGREGEGDLFKPGGWASRGGKKKERRNRLMLCRTPRVFLSGGITSTFRQEQELRKTAAPADSSEVIKGESLKGLLCQPFIRKRGVPRPLEAGERRLASNKKRSASLPLFRMYMQYTRNMQFIYLYTRTIYTI